MSTISVIQPTTSLVEAVTGLLTHDGADYSGNLVVFPGKRPAHFLRKEIATTVGTAFIPPTVLSVDELVDRIADAHTDSALRKIGALDALAILLELHRALPDRMGGDAFMTLDRFFPLGEKLFNELEEMKLAGLSEADVRQHTGVVSSTGLELIADLYASFYRMLEKDGLTTRAMRYATAAATYNTGDLPDVRTIVIAGLFALTSAEQVLLKQLAGEERTHMVFVRGPGIGDTLKIFGHEDEPGILPPEGPLFHFVQAPDLHGQVGALAADVQARMKAGSAPSEESVLVLPQPESLFPVVNHLLPMFDEEAYNISLGYPLLRTPLAGLVHSISGAVDRRRDGTFFGPDYLRVMLHPYVKNVRMGSSTEPGRILVHTIDELLSRQSGRSSRSLDEVEGEDELFTTAAHRAGEEDVSPEVLRMHLKKLHDELFRRWDGLGTVGEYASGLIGLIRFIHDETTASRHPHFRSFAEAAMRGLEELRDSLLADQRITTTPEAFQLLEHVLGGVSVPFPGSPLHGFQVLGRLETRSLRFDNVYLIDANEDVLPPSVPPPLLPETVRSAMNLETRHDRERIIDYSLSVLFAGAKHVWISWTESDGKEKSRYVERLLWEQQRRDGTTDAYAIVQPVEYELLLDVQKPEAIMKSQAEAAALARRSLSAGALDTYLRCQLRFYYGTVLGIREREELTGEIEAMDIGNLLHTTLQRYFEPWKGKQLIPESLDPERVKTLATEVYTETFGRPASAAAIMMHERVQEQLGRIIEQYQQPSATASAIVLRELEGPMTGTVGGCTFRVRMDRTEARTDGSGRTTHHILDYKTGGDPAYYAIRFDKLDMTDQSTWRTAIGSFQLFLYVMLYAQSHTLEPTDVEAAYLFLGRTTIDEGIEVGLFDAGEPEKREKLALLEGVVGELVKEMRDPAIPFSPTPDLEKDCPDCPFTTMCGTAWTKTRGRM